MHGKHSSLVPKPIFLSKCNERDKRNRWTEIPSFLYVMCMKNFGMRMRLEA